ncbi:MAG: zinc ribbon domain-containing protein [Verrucomicrobiales bacterium]
MLTEIKTLLIVQDRDTRLRRLRDDLRRLPEEAARAKARLAAEESALQAAKAAAADNEVAMRKLQLEIETRRTTIGRLKTQQFETRKNEEYAALGHEIERYTADISKLEDEELALMEKAEVLKATAVAATATLATTRDRVQTNLNQMKERHLAMTAQLTEVEAERSTLSSGIDEVLLSRYDRIFEKKAPAVVPLEHGICGGCHMRVTPTTLTQVKGEKGLAFCENCGRLLYLVLE